MSGLWFAEQVVGAAIGGAVTFCTVGGLAWLWGRRKLVPFLKAHPKIRALLEGSE